MIDSDAAGLSRKARASGRRTWRPMTRPPQPVREVEPQDRTWGDERGGCAYAGAKGVVWGPIRDMAHVSHGPVGCGWYSWGTRRNLMSGSTCVQLRHADDLGFPGEGYRVRGDKKLAVLLKEVKDLFPLAKAISVLSECPVGLIGDDINAVAKRMSQELELPVIPCNCEGFRGVSQSLGHHISNDTIRDYVIETPRIHGRGRPYDVALTGDYNIGGDVWSVKPLLESVA